MMRTKQEMKTLFDEAVRAGYWIHKDHGKWYVGKGTYPLKQYGTFTKAQAKNQVCLLFTSEQSFCKV